MSELSRGNPCPQMRKAALPAASRKRLTSEKLPRQFKICKHDLR